MYNTLVIRENRLGTAGLTLSVHRHVFKICECSQSMRVYSRMCRLLNKNLSCIKRLAKMR